MARALGLPDIYSRLNRLENSRTIPPDLYMRLEKAFRGDPSLIAERQSQYIPFVEPTVSSQHPLLDLGCGRGEWLTVLSQKGLAARGIDGNPEAVAVCQQLGLDVTLQSIENCHNKITLSFSGTLPKYLTDILILPKKDDGCVNENQKDIPDSSERPTEAS